MTNETREYEYAINGFDMAVRGLADCKCQTTPCDHVKHYSAARKRLMDECARLESSASTSVTEKE